MGISKRNKRIFICINTKLICNLNLQFMMCISLWSKVGVNSPYVTHGYSFVTIYIIAL